MIYVKYPYVCDYALYKCSARFTKHARRKKIDRERAAQAAMYMIQTF